MTKPTLALSPVLRSSVAAMVSMLPSYVSLAVGVEPGSPTPYFMDLRVSSTGLTTARQRIVFETEEQVRDALLALYRQMGLTPLVKPEAAPTALVAVVVVTEAAAVEVDVAVQAAAEHPPA